MVHLTGQTQHFRVLPTCAHGCGASEAQVLGGGFGGLREAGVAVRAGPVSARQGGVTELTHAVAVKMGPSLLSSLR